MRNYLFNLLVAIDILICAILPGGECRQTLSGRAYLPHIRGNRWWGWTLDFINKLARDPQHCLKQYLYETRK